MNSNRQGLPECTKLHERLLQLKEAYCPENFSKLPMHKVLARNARADGALSLGQPQPWQECIFIPRQLSGYTLFFRPITTKI